MEFAFRKNKVRSEVCTLDARAAEAADARAAEAAPYTAVFQCIIIAPAVVTSRCHLRISETSTRL